MGFRDILRGAARDLLREGLRVVEAGESRFAPNDVPNTPPPPPTPLPPPSPPPSPTPPTPPPPHHFNAPLSPSDVLKVQRVLTDAAEKDGEVRRDARHEVTRAENRSAARALRKIIDAENPYAPPMPPKPVPLPEESASAYASRLTLWSDHVSALSPARATLRELSMRPTDSDEMLARIRPNVNGKLMARVIGFDDKAALPVFDTLTGDDVGADAKLRVFPAEGRVGALIERATMPSMSEMVALEHLGWHVYGAEYAGRVIYLLALPVSVDAAAVEDAVDACQDREVEPEWTTAFPLLGGVPAIKLWGNHPL